MLVGGRDLGATLHVFHSRYIFPQPEPSIPFAPARGVLKLQLQCYKEAIED